MTAMNGIPATQKAPPKLPQGNKAVTRQELFWLMQGMNQQQQQQPHANNPVQTLGRDG